MSVALIRTGWDKGEGFYVGIKGGTASANHAHMDAGSFVFEAQGVRWAQDLGMQEYYSLEKEGVRLRNGDQDGQRWDVFRYNNFVHNTFDGIRRKAPGKRSGSDSRYLYERCTVGSQLGYDFFVR